MAFRTGPRQNPVVCKEGRSPARGPVTAAAVDRGGQVVRRLKCSHDSPAGRMTLHTLRRRSSKDSLQVASLAHNLRVAAAEREAGTAVIEFESGTTGTTLGLYLARQHEAKAHDQRA